MTKQTKILVSIVLCCTLLFALAITSFGADESTEIDQYIIPSGVYHGADVVPIPSSQIWFDILFSTEIYKLDEGGNLVTEVTVFDSLKFDNNDISSSGIWRIDYLYYGGSTLQSILWPYSAELGWNYMYDYYYQLASSNPSLFPEGFTLEDLDIMKNQGRTITVLEDTSVSLEEYQWFMTAFGGDGSYDDPIYEGNPFLDTMILVIEALDVPIFGTFSPWDMLTTLCGLFAVVWLLKLLAGG